MPRFTTSALLFAASSLLATTSGHAADAKPSPKPAAPIEMRLSTKGNDIAFDQAAIQVPFGSTVTLRFINEATKGSEILHNVAVIKPGSHDAVIKDLQESGYDIEKMRKHPSVLAITKALGPGEAGTIEFKPDAPGFYPYLCFMAGHADMLGMKGVLHVK